MSHKKGLSAGSFLSRALLRAIGLRNHCGVRFGDNHIDIIRRNRVIRISKRHAAYFPDMVHYFDSYFNPVFPRVEGKREVVDYSQVRDHKFRDTGLNLLRCRKKPLHWKPISNGIGPHKEMLYLTQAPIVESRSIIFQSW